MKTPQARYSIGCITTKDINLSTRTKSLQLEGHTMESIFRAGLEIIEKEIDAKNNKF